MGIGVIFMNVANFTQKLYNFRTRRKPIRKGCTMRSGVVMSLGPWYGSSLEAKEARIARPLNTYRDANQVRQITEDCTVNTTGIILCLYLLVVFSQTQQ